jgi:hypothetical protein
MKEKLLEYIKEHQAERSDNDWISFLKAPVVEAPTHETPTYKIISELTVIQLKEKLKEVGMKSYGSKAELIALLMSYVNDHPEKSDEYWEQLFKGTVSAKLEDTPKQPTNSAPTWFASSEEMVQSILTDIVDHIQTKQPASEESQGKKKRGRKKKVPTASIVPSINVFESSEEPLELSLPPLEEEYDASRLEELRKVQVDPVMPKEPLIPVLTTESEELKSAKQQFLDSLKSLSTDDMRKLGTFISRTTYKDHLSVFAQGKSPV